MLSDLLRDRVSAETMDVAVAPQTTIIRYELLNDRMTSHGRFKLERACLWILVSLHYLLS
jgi:hypothetical protein